MIEALKKTLGVCLIGIGAGILLVLLLPITGWLFIIGCALFCLGLAWLFCKKINERIDFYENCSKKVPKFLRGFVKMIFGIKDEK